MTKPVRMILETNIQWQGFRSNKWPWMRLRDFSGQGSGPLEFSSSYRPLVTFLMVLRRYAPKSD
jgi:hypothetical protein